MAARAGRLFHKKPEGGADAAYDGAYQSDFNKTPNKASTQFATAAPRFKEQEAQPPDVDVHRPGISDVAGGKPTPAWSAAKPRFKDPEPATGGDYETATSEFDHVKATPSPMMRTPDKTRDRADNWLGNEEAKGTPAPNETLPGAFDASLAKNKPSPFTSSTGPRFKENHAELNGEPNAPAKSDFEKSYGKPSPAVMSGAQRFKVQESAGDPGATKTASDIEREQREAKLARQRAQAEAEAARAQAYYDNLK